MSFSILFRLKKPRKDGLSPITCRITIGGLQAEVNTGLSVDKVEQFDNKVGQFKRNSQGNIELNKIRSQVTEVYLAIKHKNPSSKDVKEAYINWGKKPITIAQVIEKFFQSKKRNPDVKGGTEKVYKVRIRHFQNFISETKSENREMASIKTDTIRDFEVYLQEYRKVNGEPMKVREEVHKTVRSFFKYAKDHEYIQTNPYDSFRIPRAKPKKQKEYLKLRELNLLLNAKPADLGDKLYLCRTQLLLSVCLGGLTFSDISQLSLDEIREEQGQLWLEKARQKTHNDRRNPFNSIAQALYKEALELREKRTSDNNYLFDMNPDDHKTYNDNLEALMKELGIDRKITSHCSRTTLGNNLTLVGAGDHVIKSLMGHVPKDMLGIHYRHIPDKVKLNAVNTLDEAIRNPEEWE